MSSRSVEGNYRVLVVGDTKLYVPVDWLLESGFLPERSEGRDSIRNAQQALLNPKFKNVEPAEASHRLQKGDLFGQGISFALTMRPSATAVSGIAPDSQVYLLSFSYWPRGEVIAPASLMAEIRVAPVVDGWALRQQTYFDLTNLPTEPVDIHSLATAREPAAADGNRAAFRADDDLVVGFSWSRPGRSDFDGNWVRRSRNQVKALVEWLKTEPDKRGARRLILVGDPKS